MFKAAKDILSLLKGLMDYLPISQEQKQGSRAVLLPGLTYFLYGIIFTLLSFAEVSAQGADLVRLRYFPEITEEVRERLKTTEIEYSPLDKMRVQDLGIKNIDAFIDEEELSQATLALSDKYNLKPKAPSEILLSIAFSKILSMQTRAADWHSYFRPERIEFVQRAIEDKAFRSFETDRIRPRRVYALRQLNKELRIPFPLEKLVNPAGLLEVNRLKAEFKKVKDLLKLQGLEVEPEFKDYLEVLIEKIKTFRSKFPETYNISFADYRLLANQPDLRIPTQKLPEVKNETTLMMAILSLVDGIDRALKIQNQQVGRQPFEDIYGYFLVFSEFEADLNTPREFNQSIYSELGPTRVPPQIVKMKDSKAPIDDVELRAMIFEAFNPAYIEEIFNQEFIAWGERNSREFRQTRFDATPHRDQIESFYHLRTDGFSSDQRYQKSFQVNVEKITYKLPKGFEREKANGYFQDAYRTVFGNLSRTLGKAYREEASAAGYTNLEEASGRGFNFRNSIAKMGELRAQSVDEFQNLLRPHLGAVEETRTPLQFNGNWEEIRQQANLLFGDGTKRAVDSVDEFRRAEFMGGNSRKLLYIQNELVETPEGPQLNVWAITSGTVTNHEKLYEQPRYIYAEIEHELQAMKLDQSFKKLFEDFIAPSIEYIAPSHSKMSKAYPQKSELFKSIDGSDLPRIIKNAAYLEHERLMKTGDWRNGFHFRRRIR